MSTRVNEWFEGWEERQMRDPEFRAAGEKLEPAYQVARLRNMRGLTQKEVAALVGTKQSSIARLESGKAQPRLSFLRRVVEALDGELEVRIAPKEEATEAKRAPAAIGAETLAQPNEGLQRETEGPKAGYWGDSEVALEPAEVEQEAGERQREAAQ